MLLGYVAGLTFSKDFNGFINLYNAYCLHVAKKASVGRGDSFYVLICCLEVSFNRTLLDFEVMFNLPRILRCDRHLEKAPGAPKNAFYGVKFGQDGWLWGVLGLYMRPK